MKKQRLHPTFLKPGIQIQNQFQTAFTERHLQQELCTQPTLAYVVPNILFSSKSVFLERKARFTGNV